MWDSPDIGNPSGIVFSNEDYKPSGLYVSKHDDVSSCVYPEDFVTYTIAVHSLEGEQTNVMVTDVLPYDAGFGVCVGVTGKKVSFGKRRHLLLNGGMSFFVFGCFTGPGFFREIRVLRLLFKKMQLVFSGTGLLPKVVLERFNHAGQGIM
ncbi:MAG: hypothetical protein ISS71_03850 [Phycisphaerae bacterium]|nr:hypothetical protein [Phycisphaerae bacterium]